MSASFDSAEWEQRFKAAREAYHAVLERDRRTGDDAGLAEAAAHLRAVEAERPVPTMNVAPARWGKGLPTYGSARSRRMQRFMGRP